MTPTHFSRRTARAILVAQACAMVTIAVLVWMTQGVGWSLWVVCNVLLFSMAASWALSRATGGSFVTPNKQIEATSANVNRDTESVFVSGTNHDLEAMLRAMRTGVIMLGADGCIINMNRAACDLLGYEPNEVLGRTCEEIELDGVLCSRAAATLKQCHPKKAELALSASPSRRIQVHFEPLSDSLGIARGVIMLLDDLTHIRRLEQMRSDFAANVSHELRTPITSIQGYAELLSQEMDEGSQRGYAEVIERNVRRLSAIIEDLLALSRLEDPDPGQLPEHEMFRMAVLLSDVMRSAADEAHSRQINFEMKCDADLQCMGIRRLLEQAIGNLVVNAIRYGPESSTVTLSAMKETDHLVRISVADCGSGIADEHLDRIFERFYRVDRGRSREVGGTGLGLAIVKHIARVHGGEVEVQSGRSTGTVFSIVIPVTT